ncbi:unnamed protein product [Phytophthora lilii]|uniref:Unnamed protein product n=1 Tax=Phytophthora lilii TaxID=2077276 RepID=A0A9W6TGC4_9STRA|nr:unnamed protein product [Phytophthora lilii]
MWTAQQHITTSNNVLLTTATLSAVYVGWRVISGMYSQRIVDSALDKQGLHTPPSTLPMLGNTLDALFFQKERFWDWMTEQSNLSGGRPWVLRLVGRPTTLVCTSPETLEDIFKTHFDTFERGADLRDLLYAFFGDGIVGADGENWLKQRRAAIHMFTTRTLRDVMDTVVKEKTLQLRDVLMKCSEEGRIVDMKSMFGKFSSDTFTKIAFGVDLNGLSDDVNAGLDHPFNAAVEVMAEEIKEKLPSLVSGQIDVPTMDDLQELPYLEAVVKESLRLHAIATTRVPNKSVTLSDGTFVLQGCAVMMPAYATARLKSVWGEDASEYKPERWLDPETGKVKSVSPFKFGTFISGPRQCIGMRFALLEMRIATAVLFSRFDLKTVSDPAEITYEYSFTLPIKGPLDVSVQRISL